MLDMGDGKDMDVVAALALVMVLGSAGRGAMVELCRLRKSLGKKSMEGPKMATAAYKSAKRGRGISVPVAVVVVVGGAMRGAKIRGSWMEDGSVRPCS